MQRSLPPGGDCQCPGEKGSEGCGKRQPPGDSEVAPSEAGQPCEVGGERGAWSIWCKLSIHTRLSESELIYYA